MAEVPATFTIEEHTAGDGYRWKYRRYAPDGPPRAHVVFVHGIQSHGGWYEHSCERLRQAGFRVSFLDRRGAGLNEQDRGDAPSFRRLLDDLAEFLYQPHTTTVPLFLGAISWGGKLTVALQRRSPGLVNGLLLICPGFFAKVKPSLGRRLVIAGARLVQPQKLFPIPLNDPQLFTDTPHWQEFIRNDRLGLRRATARFLVESVRLDAYLRLAPSWVRVPVLLLLAGRDRIIDNERTRAYVERFASTDQMIVEYPEANHTLEFEPEPDTFITEVRRWLEMRSEGK